MEGELTRPWSDLPQELIEIIVSSLTSNPNPYPSPIDITTFRSVCTSWRSSCACARFFWPSLFNFSLPASVPCPFSHIYKRRCSSRHYSSGSVLSVTVVFSLRRPVESPGLHNNFLLFVDEYGFGKLKIRQPFSRASYTLPIYFPTNLNLSDFHATEVDRFYSLSYLYRNKNKSEFRSENVHKVVLFPWWLAAAVVVLFDRGKLGLIKFDRRIKHRRWHVIHDGKGFQFDDIVNCKGRVLGVDRGGRVYEIGHSSSEIKPIVRSSFVAGRLGSRKRFVESLGELYLVVRCNVCGQTKGTASFKVYELNVERRKWVEINSIGDRVFFFGVEFSYSVLAQQVPCQKNCILFKHQSFKSCTGDQIDHNEVFVNPINVYHLDDASHDGVYSDYSSTLWPPPDWIRPINRLERLREVAEDFDAIVMDYLDEFKIRTWRDVRRLKKMLDQSREKEQKFLSWEKRLQDNLPMKGRSVSTDIWIHRQTWRDVRHLKKILDQSREKEQKFLSWEKHLQDHFPMKRRSVSTYIRIHLDKSLWKRIAALGTEWQGCLDEIQNAIEHTTIDQGLLVNEVREMFVKHNAVIFRIEECVSGFIYKYLGVRAFRLLAEDSESEDSDSEDSDSG